MVSERLILARQITRYGLSGVVLALVFAMVYETVLILCANQSQLANGLGFAVTLILGYIIHSRWSFQNHGVRDAPLHITMRFLVVNLASFALNGFWVWLLVQRTGFSAHAPLVLILGVTPWLSFWFNRHWTFGRN